MGCWISKVSFKRTNIYCWTIRDFENDPNVTDKRFPGNPTRSYRSKSPLKIIAELGSWERHSDEEINHMLTSLKELSEQGKNVIYD